MQYIGKIEKTILKDEFGEIFTEEVVLTEERDAHIKQQHIIDYELFKQYLMLSKRKVLF